MKTLQIGFHTGAFNSAYYSFDKVVAWAKEHGVHSVECGFLDGVSWNHGLGYFPHLAAWEDPRERADFMARRGVTLTQLDAAFPISGRLGPSVAVPYVISAIRWAALAGCRRVDTTDGLHKPPDLSDREALSLMRECYSRVMEVAERYGIEITIETHGYYTSNRELMAEMIRLVDSNLLGMTFDTGNVYIAGEEPEQFLRTFLPQIRHLHLKDVAPQLASEERGKQTGIGMSHVALGGGLNADTVRGCLSILKQHGYAGAVSVECDARGGPLLEESLSWLAGTLDDLDYEHDFEGVAK